ncbi:processed acidic surface protein [Alkalihalobacillus sp. 1P02AB]|uniref:processed acidic surface protein n=1 Tax=Alkalihalobacillus sp. 1P02AB TaxID=3132260 RepID=UPI0039A58D52
MKYVSILLTLIVSLFLVFPVHTDAKVNQSELNDFLKDIGWTEQELTEYLSEHWHTDLSEFDSVEELIMWLSPVLDEELTFSILDEFFMEEDELQTLLSSHNRTIDEFKFYDDLYFFMTDHVVFDEVHLERYLATLEWTSSQLKSYLRTHYGMKYSDFQNVHEIHLTLGPVLTEENLAELLSFYRWTEAELEEQLLEDGLSLNDFKFYENLENYLYDYTTIDEAELEVYLEKIGWTKEELEAYLEEQYGMSLDDLAFVDELDWLLGEPLNEENLSFLLEEYELTKKELLSLLAEFGLTLDDFKFYNELDWFLFEYFYYNDWLISDLFDEETLELFALIGLEDYELEQLFYHIIYKMEENPDLFMKLLELDEYLNSLGEFHSADDLSIVQLTEFALKLKGFLDAFELNIDFFLVEDGKETPLSYQNLLKLTSLKNQDLLIKIFDFDGYLLADLFMNDELINSELFQKLLAGLIDGPEDNPKPELPEKPEKDSDETKKPAPPTSGSTSDDNTSSPDKEKEKKDSTPLAKKPSDNEKQTLPNTATNSFNYLLIGAIFVLIGLTVFMTRKFRAVKP